MENFAAYLITILEPLYQKASEVLIDVLENFIVILEPVYQTPSEVFITILICLAMISPFGIIYFAALLTPGYLRLPNYLQKIERDDSPPPHHFDDPQDMGENERPPPYDFSDRKLRSQPYDLHGYRMTDGPISFAV